MNERSEILSNTLSGWYASFVFWPQRVTTDSQHKLVRITGWIGSVLIFTLALPFTFLLMVTLGGVDIWRNV